MKRIVPSAASKIWMVALVATAICVVTTMPSFAATTGQIVTNDVNGVKWQLKITSASAVCLGTVTGGGGNGANSYGECRAFVDINAHNNQAVSIPATFVIDGKTYNTTRIGNRAFYYGKFSAAVVPETITDMTYYGFYHCEKMKHLCFKGPVTAAKGATQKYTTFAIAGYRWFEGCSAVKLVFVGPNEKTSSKGNFLFPNASSATFLVPRRSDNVTWDGVAPGGTTPTIIYYGPYEECGYDFWMGTGTVTAVPSTLAALATVNGYASTFKTSFFLDTRYAVTNAIGTLTSDIYSGAGIDVKGEGELTFGLAAAFTGGVTASDSATVAVNAGCRPGNGAVTLSDTAMLKVAQSGTVTLGGALTAANGTSLAFNFTDPTTAPTLAVTTSPTLPAEGTVNVKVTANDDFAKGTYTLVSGAGLTDGDLAKFAMNRKLSDNWRGALSIAGGNLILTVKPKPGMMMIVR